MSIRSRSGIRLIFKPMKQVAKTILFTLLSSLSATLAAAPDGYSVNSDSPSDSHDSLYRIDLATGQETRLGFVRSLNQTRLDVEGLAFSADGTLYGMDDESMKLFPLNIDNGQVIHAQEVSLSGLPGAGANDFGMTFGCDGNLYATSAQSNSLYRVALNGVATQVGANGSLTTSIYGLAAYGNPVQLYGISRGGVDANGNTPGPVNTASLYSINPDTGVATEIGPLGGPATPFREAGLAFDNSGQLWAVTDRTGILSGSLPNQVLRINTTTGAAEVVSTTTEYGFESLAITVPRGCTTGGGGDRATFTVQSRYVDNNNQTPVTLHLSCNTGQILDQSKTVQPNEGLNGEFEVEFVVTSLGSTPLNCTVTQDSPFGYTPSYTCLGVSDCVEAQSSASCSFTNVAVGTENLCQVQSYPNPVPFTVIKEWLFEAEEIGEADFANIVFECQNVFDGDGVIDGNRMYWTWNVLGNDQRTANIRPDFNGNTSCRAEESNTFSAVEAHNGCADWLPVQVGDAAQSCTITNTVFLEGIPTLSDYGRWLMALLLLGVGLVAVRRS
jgi:hypothetical protein